MKYCQELIHEFEPTLNPAGVEAYMREYFHTLDHLPREQFEIDAHDCAELERQMPGFLHQQVFGSHLSEDYEEWEKKLGRRV